MAKHLLPFFYRFHNHILLDLRILDFNNCSGEESRKIFTQIMEHRQFLHF